MKNNNPTNEIYEKIAEWLRVYHSDYSLQEKEKVKALIVTNMYPVIKYIAKRIARRAYDPIDDLCQAGFIGLLKAIDKYDESKNDNFRIYAGYFIIGEMKHYLRDKLNTIRVPRHIQELSIRISNFIETLTIEEVQALTSDEVASALDVSPKAVDMAMQVERRRSTISLDDVFKMNEGSLNYEELLIEREYKEKIAYEDARIIFEDAILKLPPEEKVLIDMYYKQDMSQIEIAEAMIQTPMSVNRQLKQAFELIAQIVVKKKTSASSIPSSSKKDI